jgi:zinc protease
MLTKGTKTRTATQIAEAIEFLGGSLNSGAGWNSSFISVTVTSDKVDQVLAIMSDVALNPKFDESELELLKSQTLDGLTYNLKQPSFLANYVASKYSFGEHPAGGTPASIAAITKGDIEGFYSKNYRSDMSVLIFTGDISIKNAEAAGEKYFQGLKKWEGTPGTRAEPSGFGMGSEPASVGRVLVVDLPNSGQASVGYYNGNRGEGRKSNFYYPASVLNSVLGGGYSSRLNMENRIKRGLSYGAGSNFSWRANAINFSTRAQTKNESAAHVMELVLAELKKLTEEDITNDELIPRKSVLTGSFGRNLETTGGLAGALADLYSFHIPTSELNSYVSSVSGVSDKQIRDFAGKVILGGDFIIVGDYDLFKEDLEKRFPDLTVQVIKAESIDLSNESLQK